uniref:Uncharacterized protein n=1 Tax=uncultured marine virus TaxID=186617 RepID=A0A0F7LA29_9VIRU|nr:hypothetical protein [uncultured marine virus]
MIVIRYCYVLCSVKPCSCSVFLCYVKVQCTYRTWRYRKRTRTGSIRYYGK